MSNQVIESEKYDINYYINFFEEEMLSLNKFIQIKIKKISIYNYLDISKSENINKILNRIKEIKNNKNYNDKTIKELINYISLISDLKNNLSEIIKKYFPERINISCKVLNKNFFDLSNNEMVELYNILNSIKNIEWRSLDVYIETVGFSNLIKILHYINNTNLKSDFLYYFNNFIGDFVIHKDFNRIPILNELYNNMINFDIPYKAKKNIQNINNNDLILLNNFFKKNRENKW